MCRKFVEGCVNLILHVRTLSTNFYHTTRWPEKELIHWSLVCVDNAEVELRIRKRLSTIEDKQKIALILQLNLYLVANILTLQLHVSILCKEYIWVYPFLLTLSEPRKDYCDTCS
ncbi:hypothetical protein FQA39_LY10195 [Lamprigera yunnana]|nr:hypothetical protein FQA39_LY10195 [Lamprigera yunnana]